MFNSDLKVSSTLITIVDPQFLLGQSIFAIKQLLSKVIKFKFAENPDDLLPDLEQDGKGRIQTADNLRIRPEKHDMEPGDKYNPRHHEQHYHVESRRDPSKVSWKINNKDILKTKGYEPKTGTGFLPGETFPGVI